MQRGPLLQPFRSTELVLSGPPRARKLAGLSTGRLTAARTASASSASLCLTCPVPPKRQTHPLGGFSSRRFLRKSLTPFPWGSPASPRFPLGGYASPLFPKAVTVSCLLLRRGRNRASPAFQPISVVGCFTPEPSPTKTRARILARVFWAQLFRSPATAFPRRRAPFDVGFGKVPPLLRRRRSGSLAGGAVCLADGFRLRRFRPSALQRSAIPPWRGQFPSFGTFSSNLWNFQSLENHQSEICNFLGAPAARPPIKWGPVRYAPCFFLIFAGKLKHRETVTRCQRPFRFKLCSFRAPPMQTLCVWGPT